MDKMVSVNFDRLRYAREYYGLSISDVSNKTKINSDILQKCEKGEEFLSYAQLTNLADIYKQSLLFFFMKDIPQENKAVVAYRCIEREIGTTLSKKVIEMIDKADIYRMNLTDLYGGQEKPSFKELIENNNVKEQDLTEFLRKILELTLEKQKSFNRVAELIEYVRTMFYNVGVYVFKDSFQDNSVSGLCLYDEEFPVILINNKTTFTRQLFTIFHEVYHLYLEKSDVDFTRSNIEKTCDTFASEFLIPTSDFEGIICEIDDYEDEKIIADLAKLYNVSMDAIMYRLQKGGCISSDFYTKTREDNIRNMNSESSGGNFYYTHINYLGKSYLNKVFNMYYSGSISISQVGIYTLMKSTHVTKLAASAFGGGF